MFCVCINTSNFLLAKEEIGKSEMAEIRQDLCHFTLKELQELTSINSNLIFTYRKTKKDDDETRISFLLKAIEFKYSYIDIDLDNDDHLMEKVKSSIKNSSSKLILSYHNYQNTPTNQKLFDLVLKAGEHEADIIKLVCFSHGVRDNDRILALNSLSNKIIAFNMGEKGKVTRAVCLLHGAPFTYVAMKGRQTAPGQLEKSEMEKMINFLQNNS